MNNLKETSLHLSFTFLSAGYPPLGDSCIDFYKLGISPTAPACLQLKDTKLATLNCCWNNLMPSDKVNNKNIF